MVKVVMCSRGAQPLRHRRRKGSLGGTMASAEHEPITGVWGQSRGGSAPLTLTTVLEMRDGDYWIGLSYRKQYQSSIGRLQFNTTNEILRHAKRYLASDKSVVLYVPSPTTFRGNSYVYCCAKI